uniref:Uncharacterized protein n=1 Tax=Arundo donax TaxID=35708 RepID=A0A0A8ZDW6_ARUDO
MHTSSSPFCTCIFCIVERR